MQVESGQVFSVGLNGASAVPCNTRVSLLCGVRGDGEGEGSSVAGTGHAQSLPAAGGAGSLHNDPDGEPERVRLRLRSYCKFLICLWMPPPPLPPSSPLRCLLFC